jgi:hypothetical protein
MQEVHERDGLVTVEYFSTVPTGSALKLLPKSLHNRAIPQLKRSEAEARGGHVMLAGRPDKADPNIRQFLDKGPQVVSQATPRSPKTDAQRHTDEVRLAQFSMRSTDARLFQLMQGNRFRSKGRGPLGSGRLGLRKRRLLVAMLNEVARQRGHSQQLRATITEHLS